MGLTEADALDTGGSSAEALNTGALSTEALQRLVDACPLPALLADVQPLGRVLCMNRLFMRLLEGDVAGLPCPDGLWSRALAEGSDSACSGSGSSFGSSPGNHPGSGGPEGARRWWRSLRPGRMSGRQALGKLRELLPDTPIVLLTGYALETPDAADGLLRKPVTAGALAQAVRDLLERHRRSPGL